MKISIIIPILNEKDKIESLLGQLADLDGDFEVIFADGGSNDGTLNMIGNKYPVISCPKGRAKQMNMAATHSTGDVLLFLHCDSVLPKDAMYQIKSIIEKRFEFGCFRLKFDSDKFLMKCCGFFSNMRVRLRKIVFGDQGIFITRRLFDEIGGFPDLPIMEDYKFSILLKSRHKVRQANSYITTSSRRFIDGGVLRTMWKMQKLQYMFRHGTDAKEIAKLYRNIR